MIPKPDHIVDRDEDWKILSEFIRERPNGQPGAAVAAVTGRRRTGKSFLLDRFARLTNGFYFEAQLDEDLIESQERFRDELAGYAPDFSPLANAVALGKANSWDLLLQVAMDATSARRAEGRIPPLIIDEFPYLLRDTPRLQSILKSIYDSHHFLPGEIAPPGIRIGYYDRMIDGRILISGSAMSVMHELGHGSRPLFGRLAWTLTMDSFDHIDMAKFWGIEDRRVAFTLFAALGGAPGYQKLLMESTQLPVPQSMEELDAWLSAALFRPRPDFFTEAEITHLLREDPRAGDKAIYQAAMRAIAEGATTVAKVGGVIGQPKEETDPVVSRLVSMRYVEEHVDLLRPRSEILRLTDPIIRFHHAVVRSRMDDLMRRTTSPEAAWAGARHAFRSHVLGPAFEKAAFYSAFPLLRARGIDVSDHGWTLVNNHATRTTHEVDFVGLSKDSYRRPKDAQITVIGETKATERARGLKDLERLRLIRNLLGLDHKAAYAKLVIFSMYGFSEHLLKAAEESPDEIFLFDLDDIYSWKQPTTRPPLSATQK